MNNGVFNTGKIFKIYIATIIGLCLWTACDFDTRNLPFFNTEKRDSITLATAKLYLSESIDVQKQTKLFSGFREGIRDSLIKQVNSFYEHNKYHLLWHNAIEKTQSAQIPVYIEALKKTESHGLKGDYLLPEIEPLYQSLQAEDAKKQEDYLSKIARLDGLLSTSFFAYTRDLLNGQSKRPNSHWVIEKRQQNLPALLTGALKNNDMAAAIQTVIPKHPSYEGLSQALVHYKKIAENGGWKEVASGLKKGSKGDKVQNLVSRLAIDGDFTGGKGHSDFDDSVTAALKNFQKRNGLEKTGLLDAKTLKELNVSVSERIKQIMVNMDRLRWLPDDLGKRYVWVNIPEYMVDVYDNNQQVAEIVGVVGALPTKTPILINKKLTNVIFSPTWTVPPSIAKEEMEYILMNPAVLIVADVDVFIDGKKVSDVMSIDWKNMNVNRVRMRQRPKRRNSMGLAKFMFENNHSIYLHDTPNKVDFKLKRRAESHGCVRVSEPHLLATKLLTGANEWTDDKIRGAMNSGKQQYVKPPVETRVHLVYFTTWVDDKGVLQFRNDVYGYDKRQKKSLLF